MKNSTPINFMLILNKAHLGYEFRDCSYNDVNRLYLNSYFKMYDLFKVHFELKTTS